MTKAWPSPVVHSLPDQVAQAILQRIATGELLPGHRLPSQRDLAQSMGVGLAVIREAVQRLGALNIVEATHGSGTVVRPFRWIPLIYDPSLFLMAVQHIGVRDLWEARRLLEGQIVRLAAERATEANLTAMRAVLARANPLPGDYDSSQALNRELARKINDETKANPDFPFAGKFVGIANGQIVTVGDDLDEVVQMVERLEPEPQNSFIIEASRNYNEVHEICLSL